MRDISCVTLAGTTHASIDDADEAPRLVAFDPRVRARDGDLARQDRDQGASFTGACNKTAHRFPGEKRVIREQDE